MVESDGSPHQAAAEAFARRVGERFEGGVEAVLLYGSVARGEQRGVASDVDLLVVLADDVDCDEYEHRVRELAYDVELEYGVALSLVVTTAADYAREANRPFFQQVQRDAERLYG